jgi:hypothetical protein
MAFRRASGGRVYVDRFTQVGDDVDDEKHGVDQT